MAKARRPKLKTPPAEGAPTYEVGYKKPPKESRFAPHCSGNLKGRPKGARNKRPPGEERLRSMIVDEAYREISVNDGARELRIPVARAVVRTLGLQAAKGQFRAVQYFTQLVRETEEAERRARDEYLQAAVNYKLCWERELERRERLGLNLPDPIPHPAHILVDVRKGEIIFTGPLTKEEVGQFKIMRGYVRDADFAIEYCQTELDRGVRGRRRALLSRALIETQNVRAAFVSIVGEPDPRDENG